MICSIRPFNMCSPAMVAEGSCLIVEVPLAWLQRLQIAILGKRVIFTSTRRQSQDTCMSKRPWIQHTDDGWT